MEGFDLTEPPQRPRTPVRWLVDQSFLVEGVFFLSQKLVPLMNDGGRIVNISSGLTRIIMPHRAAYGTMKAAVETMTKYMALELGERGIAVNCVAPGAIATDFSGGVVRDNPDVAKAIAGMTALGRPGQPDDIGPMIASLLSEDNRWVNAQRIEVSGGMRFRGEPQATGTWRHGRVRSTIGSCTASSQAPRRETLPLTLISPVLRNRSSAA